MRGGYDDCIHGWKVIMEALLCVIIIFWFFLKKKEHKKEIGGKSLECLDSARKRLAELCVPMVYRSKAIWKKHSHLKGHQPHCIFVSVCKMHSFSFAWVPSSRSLVGKTRKDSSQTTLVRHLPSLYAAQMVAGSLPNSPRDWYPVCRNPSLPGTMGTCRETIDTTSIQNHIQRKLWIMK